MQDELNTPSGADMLIIEIESEIDRTKAEGLAARIRAAVRNGKKKILLKLSPEASITSAEFLGFLAAAQTFLGEVADSVKISTANPVTIDLLRMTCLESLLAIAEAE